MGHLSSQIEAMKSNYTVVVIGSGYGGGISASRLARAGQKVCVLERGKEFLPGEFPDTLPEATAELQVDIPDKHIGSKTGLFDFHVNDDINVLVGCGLGGTSLINANVVIESDPRVFKNPAWPKALIGDLKDGIKKGYAHAREMLNPQPYPKNFPKLKKLEAHEKSGKFMKENFYRPPIAVTFDKTKDDINHVGVKQTPCILCGDCVSGCNHTSKNTVQTNYLPDAWNHGAEIFTEVSVRYVEKQGGKWLVHFETIGTGREKFNAPTQFVSADIVVLAAGTLGSTEILLRSQQNGLTTSDMLGKKFTGNGDVLGFGYNTDQEINGIGWGNRAPDPDNPVGPCITGIIDTRKSAKDYKEGMSIEEGSVPGALSPVLPITFSTIAKLIGKDTDEGLLDYLGEKKRELDSLIRGSYHGAVNNTQIYLTMTHDSGNGVMSLEDDRLRIKWPGVGNEKIFQKASDALKKATKALGGTYVRNPAWTKLFGHDLVTVHPLGGCIMGEDSTSGVVNHKGQVFSGNGNGEVHEGLYVSDGSVVPTSVGTNPLLTISAIAERNIALLAKERNWKIDYTLPSKPKRKVKPLKPGLQFTETMTGYLSTKVKDNYEKGAELGKKERSTFKFILTIISDDVEEMLKSKKHQSKMIGTVEASALSKEQLTVTGGIFNLFVKYPQEVDTLRMRYRMKLRSQEGKDYYFEGFKIIRDDPGLDLWSDTTTLYITVYEGKNEKAPVLGKGILKILPADFMKQMTTMKVTNADSLAERLKYQAEFGKLFAGALFDTFGGIFVKQSYFDPDATPRKRRPLRVSAPEIYDFKTEDNLNLRLTRYKGGSKGPVILSHGLGVSSRIFSMDTYETNLLEYLFAHNYDVWLLDFRASIELPAAANTQFSADEIAKYDYPAAVSTVRQITKAKTVQMVVHCYGSTAWTMSMLGGWLKNVRSAVVSQVSTHMKVPFLTKLKTGLHVPTFLDKIGIDSLTAYVDKHSNWLEKFFDDSLRFFPIQKEERCNNPVCHRITFLYGQLYEHDQLNDETHKNLHEMFGVANITSLEHLALLSRKGHVVNFQGEETYLPHLERMAIPITFISGGENECFLPESTEITYNLLREKNGKHLYKRFVIPKYGHIDCIYGKNAARDVYPFILEHLEETNA